VLEVGWLRHPLLPGLEPCCRIQPGISNCNGCYLIQHIILLIYLLMVPNLPLWLQSWLRLVPKFWLAWNHSISLTCCTCCYNVEVCVWLIMQSHSKLFYVLLLEFCQTEQKKQKKRKGPCPLTHSRTISSWPFMCVQKQSMPAAFDNSLKNLSVPFSPNSLSYV
jgi:hypothetical protein